MRQRAILAPVTALVLIAGLSLTTGAAAQTSPTEVSNAPTPAAPDLSAYDDLGTWIDIYDPWAFAHPEKTVKQAASHSVTTLYVETSNYSREFDIYQPDRMATLIRAAHDKGMLVVAWYLPGLLRPARDFHRTMAAIRFHRNGQRFDAFGLDIEASAVANEHERSRRLVALSRRIDNNIAGSYPLGAIIPSPRGMQLVQGYWENFPYDRLAPHYDVWLPMGYYTYRASGRKEVYDYTQLNTQILRDETGDPALPIHAIGGIASKSSDLETRGFTQAVVDDAILGGSLYDMGLMGPEDWRELQPIAA